MFFERCTSRIRERPHSVIFHVVFAEGGAPPVSHLRGPRRVLSRVINRQLEPCQASPLALNSSHEDVGRTAPRDGVTPVAAAGHCSRHRAARSSGRRHFTGISLGADAAFSGNGGPPLRAIGSEPEGGVAEPVAPRNRFQRGITGSGRTHGPRGRIGHAAAGQPGAAGAGSTGWRNTREQESLDCRRSEQLLLAASRRGQSAGRFGGDYCVATYVAAPIKGRAGSRPPARCAGLRDPPTGQSGPSAAGKPCTSSFAAPPA